MIVVIQSNVGGFAPGDRVEFPAGAEHEDPLEGWLEGGYAVEDTDLSASEAQDAREKASGTEGAEGTSEDESGAGSPGSGDAGDKPKAATGAHKRR